MAKDEQEFGFWRAAALIEAMAFLIALAVTFGPSKTGSDFSFAQWFVDQPAWWERLLANLVVSNLLIALFLLLGVLVHRFGGD